MGASSFTDAKAREKTVNFVDCFSAAESFFTKGSGGTSITGLSGLCGKTKLVGHETISMLKNTSLVLGSSSTCCSPPSRSTTRTTRRSRC